MLPNFLIIGAAKAGTTALFQYLGQHPQVFMPYPKEPHYWAYGDMHLQVAEAGDGRTLARRVVADRAAYEHVFRAAAPGQVVGEASPTTLYVGRAAERLAVAVPHIKLVMMLRQPADRAYSGYQFQRMRGYESLSFTEALAVEDERVTAGWHHMYHYRRMGMYAAQVQRFIDRFPASQLHVVIYDDFARDPKAVVRGVFDFLGVDSAFVPPRAPSPMLSGTLRRPRLAKLVSRPNAVRSMVRVLVPRRFRSAIVDPLRRASVRREPLDQTVRAELTTTYAADIDRLEALIGRDLSVWRSGPSTERSGVG